MGEHITCLLAAGAIGLKYTIWVLIAVDAQLLIWLWHYLAGR